ncbi:uncharacterized protein LOC142616304 [Castanea sativa]|uniref:uncharacterized protein LOC142616304 n=1 Tax=Castanea sativa TaxID=21020 RepID=UPI003F651DF6
MKPPRTKKEIRGILGRIQYISRFIAQLTMTCEPIFRLLKKEVPTVWNEQCQEAFEKIKNYLMKSPILVPPILEKPLLLYLTSTDTAMGALRALYLEETRKENAIYYISKKMLPYEEKYSPLEKTCVALVWATRKLRQYMLAYKVLLIARINPLKYLMEIPVQVGKTAKWVLLLLEFDIRSRPQNSTRSNTNMCQGCRIKLQMPKYVPRMQNQIADAIVTMASMMDRPKEDEIGLIVVEQKEEPAYCMTIEEDEEKNGEGEKYLNILQYLKDGTYPPSADKNDQWTIRRLSTNYIICGERLYRRSYDGIHLLYVTTKEAQQIIKEVHESSYGPHMNAHMLLRKILRQGYYWTIMEANCAAYV